MTLTLYNTLTRKKEPFAPLDPKNVRMYVCGSTVYDFAHIGNARPLIVFDLLFRLLRHFYGAENVTYVRNITDIDDKINARAAKEGVSIRTLTERTAAQFHADAEGLGILKPTHEPRATETIPEIVAMIGKLVASGHAYAAEGHVLFHVPSMADYGQLSRRSLDEMEAGARIDVAPYKRNPMDFVLWKPSDADVPGWESPWGRGRPGWHIECSAMSWKLLGERMDIHGGGIDLVFPHHENEIAQTRCCFGTPVMANVWMHNGMLQSEGQKMAKSVGNFVTINELLKDWPAEVLRFTMLRTHYRQPMDWTVRGIQESKTILSDFYVAADKAETGTLSTRFLEALCDDINTPAAIAQLHALKKGGDYTALKSALSLMGFSARPESINLVYGSMTAVLPSLGNQSDVIKRLVEARNEARQAKNWAESDRIRDELAAMGIAIKDNKDGTTTWEVKR